MKQIITKAAISIVVIAFTLTYFENVKANQKSHAISTKNNHTKALKSSSRKVISAKEIRIPFEITKGHIYVDAFVNKQGPFRFIVDTGASGMGRADVKLVNDLGLKVTGTTTNSDGINTSTINTVAVKSIRVGQLTQENIEVLSRDYNIRRSATSQPLMGIIGREFFFDYLLTIDYEKHEIILIKGALKTSEKNILRYDRPFHIPLQIGGINTIGYIDTGSDASLHFPMDWSKKLGIENLKEIGTARRANTVMKVFATESPVPVDIGGNGITELNAKFSELAEGINIGSTFFAKNGCAITIDQKNQLIKISCSKKAK